MAQLPEIDKELLMRALSRPNVGQTLQAGVGGFKTGVDIGTALSNQKLKRQKEEMELMKQIEEATAKQNLVQEATTPIPTTRTLREITEMRVPKMRQVPIDPMDESKGTTYAPDEEAEKDVQSILSLPKDKLEQPETKTALDILSPKATIKTKREVPLTEEELAQEKSAKEGRLFKAALNVPSTQEKYAESLAIPKDTTESARQMQLERVYVPGRGVEFINVDKVNKKVYSLQGEDITDKVKGSVPYFAPATFVGPTSVSMIPRIEGTYRPTEQAGLGGKASINELMPTEVNVLEKVKEDFNTDPSVKAALAKQADYEMADSVVGIGNWVGDAAILSVAAKGLGRDVGNLSQEEQRRYRMSSALLEKIKTQANLWAKGVIRDSDRDAFKEAIRVMKLKNLDILNSRRNTYGKVAEKRIKNIDPQWAKDYIFETQTLQSLEDKPSLDELADQIFGGGK